LRHLQFKTRTAIVGAAANLEYLPDEMGYFGLVIYEKHPDGAQAAAEFGAHLIKGPAAGSQRVNEAKAPQASLRIIEMVTALSVQSRF